MHKFILAATALAALAAPAVANAASITEAVFPAGVHRIQITGGIMAGDDAVLRNVYAQMQARGVHPSVIDLDSPGGSVGPALKMADFIHGLTIATRIAETARCASACVLLFYAGDVNAQWNNGRIAVHRAHDVGGVEDATSDAATTAIAQKLMDFGVDMSVIQALVATPPGHTTDVDPPVEARCGSMSCGPCPDGYHAFTNADVNAMPGIRNYMLGSCVKLGAARR